MSSNLHEKLERPDGWWVVVVSHCETTGQATDDLIHEVVEEEQSDEQDMVLQLWLSGESWDWMRDEMIHWHSMYSL